MIRSLLHAVKKKLLKEFILPGNISKRKIRQFLPKNRPLVIVEAGAHKGSDTIEMVTLWKDIEVHAFEPIPELFEALQENTKAYPNIHIYPLALGEYTGVADIYISSGKSDASSSLLIPKKHLEVHPQVVFSEKKKVNIITLDEWAKQNQIDHIDMLWLDLQGYEYQVLKQSLSILKSVQVIYTEVNTIETYENTMLYQELKTWLLEQGFVAKQEELVWQEGGNVLFIRENVD